MHSKDLLQSSLVEVDMKSKGSARQGDKDALSALLIDFPPHFGDDESMISN
jgi:hypothetical protein